MVRRMSVPTFSLEGKVALVTGGSRGIGRAIAVAFAGAGADVIVCSRKLPDLEKVTHEIRELGRKSLAVAAHVGKIEELNNLANKVVEEFGKIDILVNNAGTNPVNASVIDYEERLWDSIMNINLKGVVFLSQKVAKIMKERGGGSIINIASIEGFRVGVKSLAYDISKAGIIHFTRIAATEWAPYNIRVNAIAPGFTKTNLVHSLWENEAIKEKLVNKIPIKRMADPDDMAGTALYLASNASAYTTGATIVVDGGMTLPLGMELGD
jgi:dehydrogenase/reductase SDR family protein 4